MKDVRQRLNYKHTELEQLVRKVLKNNTILSEDIRGQAHKSYVKKEKRKTSLTLIRNRCLITGRSRAVIKEYGRSRIKFKQLADQGKIPGLRKACW